MCGIAGIIRKNAGIDVQALCAAAELMHNRGPDSKGVWSNAHVGFAHRRLSIIDTSESGHQPMLDEVSGNVITYNGEVYNFKEIRADLQRLGIGFTSQCDTEVILKAYRQWGNGCIARFNGMFAFAIWDKYANKLFVVRDRMGVKPLYYHYSDSCFAFASRPKVLSALLPELSKDWDRQGIRLFLEAGYIPAPYTHNPDIRKLPAAHYLEISLDNFRLKQQRYWDFRDIRTETSWENRAEDDLLDELDALLNTSVKARMVSDVPLGSFLSGGIDSSLVTAIMQRYSTTPVKTFTIGFEENSNDESAHAEQVASFLKTDHYCEKMKVDDLIELLPQWFDQYDEPFFDHSGFAVMAVSRMTRRHVTVALSGDGGDELFGGYHYYNIMEKLKYFYALPKTLRLSIATLLSCCPNHRLKILGGALTQSDLNSAFAFSRGVLKDYRTVLTPELLQSTHSFADMINANARSYADNLSAAEIAMRNDISFTLVDAYLQKIDVGTMAFSLEGREPMLDYHLVEWAMKLPTKWKIRNNVNKYLLRKLAYRYIPQKILDKPKMGFGVPMEQWLRGRLKDWAAARLNNSAIIDPALLNQTTILEAWNQHLTGQRNLQPLLWTILVFLEHNKYSMKIV